MGRGLLQTTGRSNYTTAAAKLGIDCVNHPELLEEPTYAALSACQFWLDNKCGTLALADDILRLTKRINGGTNGLEDRQARTKVSKSILIGK
jgi:putative chitinase